MSRRFNRRPLTEAERAARRQVDRDRIEQAARAAYERGLAALDQGPRATGSRYTLLISGAPVNSGCPLGPRFGTCAAHRQGRA